MDPSATPRQAFTKWDVADAASWAGVERLTTLPHITSLADYYRAVGAGMVEAQRKASTLDLLTEVTLPEIRRLHEIVFADVHPWAGDVRAPLQGVTFGAKNGADGVRIEPELALASMQMRWIIERSAVVAAETEVLRHAAIAFYHARFERIHPFRDGNGRVGRIILYAQLRQLTGEDFRFREDQKSAYVDALRAADENELVPLVDIPRRDKPKALKTIPSPFRMAPLSADDLMCDLPLQEQFLSSFRH